MYGVNERQFRKTFEEAGKMPGKHGENFMILLESRLDNLVYRLGLARTRRQARQLVTHGHILVDGSRVNIPSYRVKPGQTIAVREKSRNLQVIKEALEANNYIPDYLSFDPEKWKGRTPACRSVPNCRRKSTKRSSSSSTRVKAQKRSEMHQHFGSFFLGVANQIILFLPAADDRKPPLKAVFSR